MIIEIFKFWRTLEFFSKNTRCSFNLKLNIIYINAQYNYIFRFICNFQGNSEDLKSSWAAVLHHCVVIWYSSWYNFTLLGGESEEDMNIFSLWTRGNKNVRVLELTQVHDCECRSSFLLFIAHDCLDFQRNSKNFDNDKHDKLFTVRN